MAKGDLPPIDLQVDVVGLDSGRILLVDTATAKFKEIYELKDVTFLIKNINLTKNKEMKIKMGFGISVTEIKAGKKTDKDINLDVGIDGKLKVFDKKGVMNPTGLFTLALRNGRFTGLQAYEQLKGQAQDISKSIHKIQGDVLKGLEDAVKNLNKAKKLGISKEAGKIADNVAKIDTSFIKDSLEWDFLKDTLEFDKVETIVKIQDGKIITEDLKIDCGDFALEGGGYTDMDSNIKYDMLMLLAKKYNKNEITKAVANKDGKPEFPIKARGTFSDPKVMMEQAMIKKKIKNRLSKMLQEKIKKETGGLDVGGSLKNQAQDAAKKAAAEAQKKLEAEAKAKIEAEKKKQEDAAKKKAADAVKKLIPKKLF